MPAEVATVEVIQTRTVVVEVPGPSYSDARVLAYLRTLLLTNGDLLTVASGTLARITVGAAPAGSVPIWSGSAWSVGTLTVAVAWNDITGKPSTFPPSTHAHTPSDVTGFNAAAVDAVEAVGDGVLVTTGGAAAAVVGATTNHALLWNGTTWVAGAVPYSALSGVPSTFAPSSHTHTASEITDFSTAWTDRLTALGSGATTNDVLAWNGSAFVAATPSGGGMTNPMTSPGDLIGGGASGTPTRIAVPDSGHYGLEFSQLDSAAGWNIPGPWGAWGPGRWSAGYAATATAAPSTVGTMGAAWTRISSGTTSSGSVIAGLGGATLQQCRTLSSSGSWAGWYALLGTPTNTWYPAGLQAVIRRVAPTTAANQRIFVLVSHDFMSVSAIVTADVPAVGGESVNGFGLRCKGTQTNWEFVALDNTTPNAPVDTGIPFAVGDTHAVHVWQDTTACRYEIWDASATPWVRLGGGEITGHQPAAGQLLSRSMAVSVGVINLSNSLESVQFALPMVWMQTAGRFS